MAPAWTLADDATRATTARTALMSKIAVSGTFDPRFFPSNQLN